MIRLLSFNYIVERNAQLDAVFHSLADTTRRDILRRVSKEELSISVLAKSYQLSFAATAKHVKVLEAANLIQKRREGKQQLIGVMPKTLRTASKHLGTYEEMWRSRLNNLDDLLNT